MLGIIKLLQRTKSYLFIIYGILFSLIISVIVGFFSSNLAGKNFVYDYGNVKMFIVAVIFAPFIETFVFQSLPYIIVERFFKHKTKFWVYLIFSAIIFIHYNSYLYALVTFLIGFIFAFFYYIAILRKESAFLLVTMIHGILNLIAAIAHIH